MNLIRQRLFICGSDERRSLHGITHQIVISNPGSSPSTFDHSQGYHLNLQFGDVASEADAKQYHTQASLIEDVDSALQFFRRAWAVPSSRVLISCDYGASRSPALAYLCLADLLGPGHEAEAFAEMLEIRPTAVPNAMIVRLGDTFLARQGAALKPLKEFYAKLNAELFPGSPPR